MAEVKVERRHREAAAALLGIRPSEQWLETGVPITEGTMSLGSMSAKTIAEAEQRGYQRCQADVAARARWLADKKRKTPGPVASERVLSALGAAAALESFAGHVERGEHAGASDAAHETRKGKESSHG